MNGSIRYAAPQHQGCSGTVPVDITLTPQGDWRVVLADAPYSLHDLQDQGDSQPLCAFLQYLAAAALMLPYHGTSVSGPHLWASLSCAELNIKSEDQ